MIKLYYDTPRSKSYRKARHWLKHYHIHYQTRNLNQSPLQKWEIIRLLEMSDGIKSFLKRNEKNVPVVKKYRFNQMPFRKFVDFVTQHQNLIKKPLIFDHFNLVSGFNANAIRCFIPRSYRKLERQHIEARLQKIDDLHRIRSLVKSNN